MFVTATTLMTFPGGAVKKREGVAVVTATPLFILQFFSTVKSIKWEITVAHEKLADLRTAFLLSRKRNSLWAQLFSRCRPQWVIRERSLAGVCHSLPEVCSAAFLSSGRAR